MRRMTFQEIVNYLDDEHLTKNSEALAQEWVDSRIDRTGFFLQLTPNPKTAEILDHAFVVLEEMVEMGVLDMEDLMGAVYDFDQGRISARQMVKEIQEIAESSEEYY